MSVGSARAAAALICPRAGAPIVAPVATPRSRARMRPARPRSRRPRVARSADPRRLAPVPLLPRALPAGARRRPRLDHGRRPALRLACSRSSLPRLVAASRTGVARLRAARWLWIPGALLLAWLAFQTFGPSRSTTRCFADHLVSYLKFVEYALLAVAVPLLVRRADDLTIVLGGLVLWGAVAAGRRTPPVLRRDIFGAWNAGWRQPSFLGHHDLAALSAIASSLAAAGIVARRREIPAPRAASSSRSSSGCSA